MTVLNYKPYHMTLNTMFSVLLDLSHLCVGPLIKTPSIQNFHEQKK